jgi:hypothetical protein
VIVRRALPLALLVVLSLPVAAGGTTGSASRTNPLCLRLRAADSIAFRQLFPANRGGLGLCTRVQTHREACRIQTARDLQAPANMGFGFTCRWALHPSRTAGKRVTQFIVAVKRRINSVQPVNIGTNPPQSTTFHCGVRNFATRASLVCIGGSIPYGKPGVGSMQVSPNMGCDVKPLVAIRVANGNWDLFAVTKAPRTINGPPCPGRHF